MGNVITEGTLNLSPIYDFTSNIRVSLSVTAKCSPCVKGQMVISIFPSLSFNTLARIFENLALPCLDELECL